MPSSIPSLPIPSPSRQPLAPPLLPPPSKSFPLSSCRFLDRSSNVDPVKTKSIGYGWRNRGWSCLSSINGVVSNFDPSERGNVKKRNVVEHILLLKAKADLTDVEEKDMLDNLYTSQYQMRGVIAISLGRIEEHNADNFTHAVYMRFQTKEDLAKFYLNSYYSRVLKEHVMPHCYELMSVDYESEVEDDILPIFRRGEDFNYGVETVLLLSTTESADENAIEDALATLKKLISDFRSIIVQATQGLNFNLKDYTYTHAAVIRFPSVDAFELFRESSEYKDMWRLKFQPITKKALLIHFSVDPVGTELM